MKRSNSQLNKNYKELKKDYSRAHFEKGTENIAPSLNKFCNPEARSSNLKQMSNNSSSCANIRSLNEDKKLNLKTEKVDQRGTQPKRLNSEWANTKEICNYYQAMTAIISQTFNSGPINSASRKHVVTWLVEVTHKMGIKTETLFHSVMLLDEMIANDKKGFNLEDFQLLAISCLFISCKYEEVYPPAASIFVSLAEDSYSKRKVIEMESRILQHLQFRLTYPTRFIFCELQLSQQNQSLLSSIGVSKFKRLRDLAIYLLELSLLEHWGAITESEISAAALFLAKKVLRFDFESLCQTRNCQIAWRVMGVWRQNKQSIISYIFDCDKYSFVGGIFLEDL